MVQAFAEDHCMQKIGRYTVQGVLGEGAMGRVLLAFDAKLDRQVAIKVMSQQFAEMAGAQERFAREATAIVKLRHPNIVEIFDHGGGDTMHLVMERLVGSNLLELVDERGPLPEGVAASIIAEVCRALEHAHQWGVIHRDLKPANVIAEWNGRVVLTDFGLVKAYGPNNLFNTSSWRHTQIMGTPGFMPPEQMLGQPLGPTVDVFALGVLYYYLLTGKVPYASASPFELIKLVKRGEYADPRFVNPSLSDVTIALLQSCLQADPGRRPQSADACRMALQRVFRECQITDPRDVITRHMRAPEMQAEDLRQQQLDHVQEQLKVHSTVEVRDALVHRMRALHYKTMAYFRRSREARVLVPRAKLKLVSQGLALVSAELAIGISIGALVDLLK